MGKFKLKNVFESVKKTRLIKSRNKIRISNSGSRRQGGGGGEPR
jgi:hypothetical protein